jgi:hypothetical protein
MHAELVRKARPPLSIHMPASWRLRFKSYARVSEMLMVVLNNVEQRMLPKEAL